MPEEQGLLAGCAFQSGDLADKKPDALTPMTGRGAYSMILMLRPMVSGVTRW
jgi:hypothetical protein